MLLRLAVAASCAVLAGGFGPALPARQSREGPAPVAAMAARVGRRYAGLVLGGVWLRPEQGAAFTGWKAPDPTILADFDPPRDSLTDAALASGFASGEIAPGYEREAATRKQQLFAAFRKSLPARGATVVEVGLGAFPNAELYAPLVEACIIGVDPNDSNGWHAQLFARRAGFQSNGNTLQVVHGVCEALPVGGTMVCDLQSSSLGSLDARPLNENNPLHFPSTHGTSPLHPRHFPPTHGTSL